MSFSTPGNAPSVLALPLSPPCQQLHNLLPLHPLSCSLPLHLQFPFVLINLCPVLLLQCSGAKITVMILTKLCYNDSVMLVLLSRLSLLPMWLLPRARPAVNRCPACSCLQASPGRSQVLRLSGLDCSIPGHSPRPSSPFGLCLGLCLGL